MKLTTIGLGANIKYGHDCMRSSKVSILDRHTDRPDGPKDNRGVWIEQIFTKMGLDKSLRRPDVGLACLYSAFFGGECDDGGFLMRL